MKKWILVLIMTMSTIIPAKAAYQDKSKFKTVFTIQDIDKPDDNRTFRKDGTKWRMSGTWVRVKIKNNLKKETAFKAELSVYNRNKELVKTFSGYNINPRDSKYFDESEGAVQGKKSISIFFKIPNNYEKKKKLRYYEVKITSEGKLVARKTKPVPFLKELLAKEGKK